MITLFYNTDLRRSNKCGFRANIVFRVKQINVDFVISTIFLSFTFLVKEERFNSYLSETDLLQIKISELFCNKKRTHTFWKFIQNVHIKTVKGNDSFETHWTLHSKTKTLGI